MNYVYVYELVNNYCKNHLRNVKHLDFNDVATEIFLDLLERDILKYYDKEKKKLEDFINFVVRRKLINQINLKDNQVYGTGINIEEIIREEKEEEVMVDRGDEDEILYEDLCEYYAGRLSYEDEYLEKVINYKIEEEEYNGVYGYLILKFKYNYKDEEIAKIFNIPYPYLKGVLKDVRKEFKRIVRQDKSFENIKLA